MDTERSGEVLDASPQQEEVVMEKEAVSKPEAPEESTEPGKSPAAAEETEQLAVNGHGAEVVNLKQTEELIVTEPVTLSEEKADGDSSPKDASDPESAPVVEASPEPDESSEKISEAEPDKLEPEQEPVPENEPVPVQATLAESVPVPEPATLTQSEPEAELEEQTLPEPVALQEPVAAPPAAEEENLPEQVETKAELQAMDAGAEIVKEGEAENDAVAEPLNEVQEEKPAATEKAAEMVSVTEVALEKPTLKEEDSAEVGNEKSAEDKKEAEPEKSAEDKKEAEPEKSAEDKKEAEPEKSAEDKKEAEPEKSAEDKKEAEPEKSAEDKKEAEAEKPESDTLKEVAAEVVEPEQNNAELVKEEDAVPASGSLSFALLEQEQTKDALRTSRTLIVLRGLPGSGKSFLARAIADAYKGHCSVICADDHSVKPENPESSAGGYKALDEAVVSCCSAGTSSSVLIVVDDTNHSQDRLARMGEIAEEHRLVAIFLEPQTPWSCDLAQLTTKSSRGLAEAQLDAMKGPLEEMSIPLFFGFFLLSSIQDKIRCTSMDFLKTLDTLEPFKTHMTDFTGKPDKEVDLEQYFKATGSLHCTTKYCNYGKAEGAKEYAQKPAVKELYGSTTELALSALFVTPRTVGARVSLTEEQLLLWPDDAEKEAESSVPAAASLPLGSRAHITLGCAEGVEPVQTGLDLLDILALQQEGQKAELVVEMELGSLTYYGEGRWLLLLREPICALACFSSSYKRKEPESTKKEPEKKKKMKCTLM